MEFTKQTGDFCERAGQAKTRVGMLAEGKVAGIYETMFYVGAQRHLRYVVHNCT